MASDQWQLVGLVGRRPVDDMGSARVFPSVHSHQPDLEGYDRLALKAPKEKSIQENKQVTRAPEAVDAETVS